MFLLVHALALVSLLSAAKGAAVPPVPRFDLGRCAASATAIVVTDPEGVVLECWRGELKPGEVVRLGLGLTPANALPWSSLRLRPDRAVSRAAVEFYTAPGLLSGNYDDGENPAPGFGGWFAAPAGADVDLRLVLFLRKEGGPGGVWMPARVPPSRPMGYDLGSPIWGSATAEVDWPAHWHISFPQNAAVDFTTSVVWAEAGRVVANGHSAPLALGLKEFKADVLACPAPPVVSPVAPRECAPIVSVDLTPKGWNVPPR